MITRDDILRRVRIKTLIELTQDNPDAVAPNWEIIDEAIRNAIDTVRTYTSRWDGFVKELAIDIAIYYVYKKRISESEILPQGERNLIVENYKQALKELSRLSRKIWSGGKKDAF